MHDCYGFCLFSASVLFDHMNLQIVEIDGLNKIILRESCLIVALKILNRSIQPNRFAQIKLIA